MTVFYLSASLSHLKFVPIKSSYCTCQFSSIASDVDDVITNSSGVGCLFIICFVFASYVQIIYLKQVAGAKLASLFSLFFFYIARGLQNRGHREKYSHLLRAR